ncbi:MAG: MgtC/SapB family protein [Candidatus Omnitrophica bacterium]|nr:MgtC/SapB family protein [Candidatus Omnitrophota bacterium]MBU1996330.1 MgtC/SapB family protein [Candidatus Omnitrophota bacterium]
MDPNLLELILKISLTIVLSGIIGAERELRHKGAGLRTHVLVCLGSTLIAITSIYLFDKYNSITTIDPTRMITGIIQGVGFLCAGTIIRGSSQISGLTTAATLWVVSGIGIAVGSGYYIAAIITSLTVFFVLTITRVIEKKIHKMFKSDSGG